LLGEGDLNRKEWIKNRLEEPADVFAIGVGGFSVMDGAGRIHRSAVSPRKGFNLGGSGQEL
jgi:hypothetical protein